MPLPKFRRRLRILLVIGAVPTVLIWAGDILMLHALVGFTLPWFARKSDRELLRWAAILFAVPTVFYLVVFGGWMLVAPAAAAAPSGGGKPARIQAIFEAVGTGGVREGFIGNLVLLAGCWADLFASMRFPKVLGMFVLGLWTVRAGLALDPSNHRPTLVRWSGNGVG